MAGYSIQEKVEMMFLYGECGRNGRETAREYSRRFPGLRIPDHRRIQKIVDYFKASGSISRQKNPGRPRVVRNEENEADVLAYMEANPHHSIRTLAGVSGITRSSIHRILSANRFHPFHVQLHQTLSGQDFEKRETFCNWMLNKLEENATFSRHILFSDEATFHRNGTVNVHNAHYWASENPHWLRADRHQIRWKLNVWCGIIGNKLVGPFFLEGNLNVPGYMKLLEENVADAIDDLPLSLRIGLWFQHDGAPPHAGLVVQGYLNEGFPGRWIGRGGPVSWPPRSPDLSPLDFFLWGYVKNRVYETERLSQQDLRERIVSVCREITPRQLRAVRINLRKRLQHCIVAEGHHFEHVL